MRETRPTVDSYFVLVKTYQHGIAFQPQAMNLQGRVQRTGLRLSSHRMHVGDRWGMPNIPQAMRAERGPKSGPRLLLG